MVWELLSLTKKSSRHSNRKEINGDRQIKASDDEPLYFFVVVGKKNTSASIETNVRRKKKMKVTQAGVAKVAEVAELTENGSKRLDKKKEKTLGQGRAKNKKNRLSCVSLTVSDTHRLVKQTRKRSVAVATAASSVLVAMVSTMVARKMQWTMSGPEILAPSWLLLAVIKLVNNDDDSCVPTSTTNESFKQKKEEKASPMD